MKDIEEISLSQYQKPNQETLFSLNLIKELKLFTIIMQNQGQVNRGQITQLFNSKREFIDNTQAQGFICPVEKELSWKFIRQVVTGVKKLPYNYGVEGIVNLPQVPELSSVAIVKALCATEANNIPGIADFR